MTGAYITIGILITVLLLILFAGIYPRMRKYRLVLRSVQPKKRRSKPRSKKKKSVWIKVI